MGGEGIVGLLRTDADYIIYKENSIMYAKDGMTGTIAFSGTVTHTLFQNCINELGSLGGRIHVKKGHYELTYQICPAPIQWGNSQDITGCLFIEGDGMYNTTIAGDSDFVNWGTYIGLIGYASGTVQPVMQQLTVRDLTLDGNYDGVDGGDCTMRTDAGCALVSVAKPHTDAYNYQEPQGKYHLFERVRFYRSPAFGFQPLSGGIIRDCIFDGMGQPDKPIGSVHWDIVGGGGWQDVHVENCTYLNSSGNYIDFVSGNTLYPDRAIFINNRSYNHQIGGVYCLGIGSRVEGNILTNSTLGSAISYDGDTHADNRGSNCVRNNILTSIDVVGVGAEPTDIIEGNIGYLFERRGTVALADQEWFAHSLALTPTWVGLYPMGTVIASGYTISGNSVQVLHTGSGSVTFSYEVRFIQ